MKTVTEKITETTVAMRIAGEDIACGDYVSVLTKIVELPSYLWDCSENVLPPEEPVRIRINADDAGQPYKVIGICLPFVYVKKHCGAVLTLDTRQKQLVRLDKACARTVWKELKSKTEIKFSL
jgi:hypothetical protein